MAQKLEIRKPVSAMIKYGQRTQPAIAMTNGVVPLEIETVQTAKAMPTAMESKLIFAPPLAFDGGFGCVPAVRSACGGV